MQEVKDIVYWYAQHKDYFDLLKDIIFAIGVIATFYGYSRFLKFLTQRKMMNKRQEMENDSRLFSAVQGKLKNYVDDYEASPKNLHDIGIRLLYMNNYPYRLEDDGFSQMLYYYFLSESHKATGYISTKGLYIMDNLWFWGDCIYYNTKNGKWFIDKKGLSFKNFRELKHRQLVKRIPFSNILGYDFDSDWADKGEPVFYTKHKYYKWKLYADDLEGVSIDEEFFLAHKISLKKNKRTKRIRGFFKRVKNKIKIYFMRLKRNRNNKTSRTGH